MDANGLRFWMLSQLNDWLPPWRAVTAYVKGQGIVDANGNFQIAQIDGVSGAVLPSWSNTVGETTVDGGLTWQNFGPGSDGWQAGTAYLDGQYVLDSNGNLQRASVTLSSNGTSGAVPPAWPTALGDTVEDANLTWSCAGPPPSGLFYCGKTNRLQLRSMRTGDPPVEDFNAASILVQRAPMTLDQFENYARWDQTKNLVVAGGSGPLEDSSTLDEVAIYTPPQPAVTDLAMGQDGVLYIALAGSLVMVDRRGRWPDFTLTVADFNFWRLIVLPEGGVLALDSDKPQIGKVSGLPLQTGPIDIPNPGILRPCQANPNPPRIVSRFALPAGETFVALAPMDLTTAQRQFALLSWSKNSADNPAALLRLCTDSGLAGPALQLGGVRLPYGITWIGNSQLAVLATNLNEALIYDLSDAGETLVPAGETYILSANNVGPFVHGFDLPPNYANLPDAAPVMFPLLPLSLNSLSPKGASSPVSPAVIDCGMAQAVWHRIFCEAIVPPRCGVILWLTSADTKAKIFDSSTPWYPHSLGAVDTSSISADLQQGTPQAVWQSIPTEVAFSPTLLDDPPVKPAQGLFMALIQRANKAVRNLSGRFLGVRIQLNGDGRNSPEIAALRAYASRFSYVRNYLPEVYRETKFGPDADADGPSTRPDFLERFVSIFESQLTRIEDRVANSYLLTRSESTPDDSLGWLGGWIGIEPNNYPPDSRRARIQATPNLYKWRGSVQSVSQALDVATDGACSRGAIIVIEDFRLRHIFATILGADLSIKDDPLLPGYSGSSNSIVGDTLFLGDPGLQAELQALYAKDLEIAGSAQAIQSLYDSLAHRMTVFVHDQVENINLKLVERIVEIEKPAHVQAAVLVAKQPFMVGLASLLGVNTYLGPNVPRNPVRVGVSDVGHYDVVMQTPSLDPRMEGGWTAPTGSQPLASLRAPQVVSAGRSILLDGTGSTSPAGTDISTYQWRLVRP